MDKDEWVKKWLPLMVGTIALGAGKFQKNLKDMSKGEIVGAEQVGSILLNIDDTAEKLLGKLWDDLAREMPKAEPAKEARALPSNGLSRDKEKAKP
jgi:hypothetical protein